MAGGNQIYSDRVVVPGAAFTIPPDFNIPFLPTAMLVENEDGTVGNYIEFSFDGVTVGGRVQPGSAVNNLKGHGNAVWIRGPGAGVSFVQVIAEP